MLSSGTETEPSVGFDNGGQVICKPWPSRNSKPGMFSKKDFRINMRDRTITCPAGQVEEFTPGQTVHFDPNACGPCPLRSQCTLSASGRGRSVKIAEDEQRQQKLRKRMSTRKGRRQLRGRTPIEHRLAALRRQYRNDAQALAVLDEEQQEIDLFRNYGDYYGYVFYIMQKH